MRARSEGARWGLLGTTLVLGATLIGTSWSTHRETVRASTQLTLSQGETLLASIRRDLETAAGLPTSAEIEESLERNREAGLRYVAMVDPRGSVLVSAGERMVAPTEPFPSPRPEARSWREEDDVWLLVSTAGGPRPEPRGRPGGPGPRPGPRGAPGAGPPGRPGPAPGPGSPRRPPGRPAPPPEPWLAIEFEASTARLLVSRTTGTLVAGTASALVLMVAALLFWHRSRAWERAQRQLEQQERLSDLGKMSAVLAHELLNPLASLKGHAQLLAERIEVDHPQARKVRRIVGEATRLERLTSDLLDFVRSGNLERVSTDPCALLDELVEELPEGSGGERLEIRREGAPERWSLDRGRIRQVLGNLVRNALQASPPDAPVEVTVDVVPARSGRQLRFVVRDRGPGLPAGREEEIFEPFFTTRTRGTGLGLAVARRIVELHGGALIGRTLPTGGAELEVRIPEG